MTRSRTLVAGLCVLWAASFAPAQPGGQPGGFPGGPFQPPAPGEVLPAPFQDQLKLNAEQKKRLADLQKEVDAKLARILTAEQKKSLEEMRAGRFGPGGFNPGGFGQRGFGPPGGFGGFAGPGSLDDVKRKLGATDEEWKVLGPKLQKVISGRQTLNAEARADFAAFGRGPFGPGGPGQDSPVAQAQAELRALLDDPKHTKAEVDEKMAAVRKARQKARADLEAAQKDLQQMVTANQEAVLVSLGYLE